MAERRMFAKQIVESDAFTEMPASTQCLYFHLGMNADDEGFVNSPKKIQRMIGAADDDLKLLMAKRFIIAFDSGVIVIKHWKINNYLQKDRVKDTLFQDEKSTLIVKPNGAYTDCIQNVYIDKTRQEQISTDKNSIDKFSLEQTNSVADLLSDEEIEELSSKMTVGGFLYLCHIIDEQGNKEIKNPYNYVLQVAKNRGFIK